MKFHKVILLLALAALIIIFDGAESVLLPPFTPTPTIPPPTTTPPPPPTTPPPPKTTSTSTTPTLPPPPPPTTSSTSTTTNPFLPPPPPSSSLPSPSLPPSSPSIPLSPSYTPPLTSSNPIPPPTPSKPQTPSSSAANPGTQFDCSVLLPCSDSKTYCDIPAGKCRVKKNVGDRCNNDDNECLAPLVCRENTCGYSDVETANVRNKNGNDNYNVKKVAIFGAIIVGASGICGLVFFVIRYLKKKRDYDIASRLYSTDDDMSEGDPYPFAERSNSFSKNTPQPPRAPTTNRYDNLPPTGNRAFAPRPGYQNYYNKYNEGMYMRQNMPNEETRTMNLLQQTRGNVMVTPQQNYNWNMRMNQGGLFPIPSVNVVPSPNNMNNVVHPQPNIKNVSSPNNMNNVVSSPKNVNNVASSSNNMNNTRNINNINSPGEDDDSKNDHVAKTLRYSVDYTNDQNNHQTNKPKVVRRDSNTLSSDDIKEAYKMDSKVSKETQSTYNPSILDTYARESIFAKTLEVKLSQSSMKFTDESNAPTIQQNISRTQPFNAYDPVPTVVAE